MVSDFGTRYYIMREWGGVSMEVAYNEFIHLGRGF